MVSTPTLRIARLRTLIDHPRTGAGEREAAQRMLDRILEKPRPIVSGRSYGSRHSRVGRHAGLSRIVDMIREDISFARNVFATTDDPGGLATLDPIGDAPSQIRYEVDAPYDAGIVITVSSVPRTWGWTHDHGMDMVSPTLQALADELAEIMNGYNHDGQDITKRFYGKVLVDGQTLVW